MLTAVLLAVCANIAFSTASLYYARFSEKYSAEWMNFYKAVIATIGFAIIVAILGFSTSVNNTSYLLLVISGCSGLFIGDIFLLKAMARIGAGRTLMLFGFSPLVLGVSAYFLFNQEFNVTKLFAILCLIGCLWSFALENFKKSGHWEVKGLLYALIGVLMDCFGIILTRQSFEISPDMTAFQANVVRAFATVVGFTGMAMIPYFKFSPRTYWKKMDPKDIGTITIISFLGTCVSLGFYLNAIKMGHLATVSAIAVTSPLFATLLEIVTGRKKPNRYLLSGLAFFIFGFVILIF